MPVYKLSPSDLTFLWDECPRCFYLKVVRKFSRPASAFPAIFSKIDGLMKGYFQGRPTGAIHPSLQPGKVQFGERWVQSQPISLPGHVDSCYILGKFDTVVSFEDGSYGVVDFKTSQARPSHLAFYGRQLHAYAYALEHPAGGKLSLSPISCLGLLVVEPVQMTQISDQIAYLGSVTWQEIPLNPAGFLSFINNVLSVLERPDPPEPAPNCAWCQYRAEVRQRDD
ncbi:MAG TPA: PD-(D/E)XK nuclease family protein [Anaerolineaceae bacterium]|nr:PD-(D/E)XK nuclease family protein [Anaerolineaceae bacterium]